MSTSFLANNANRDSLRLKAKLTLILLFTFAVGALPSLASSACGCSGDSTRTIMICIDGSDWQVSVSYCHIASCYPSIPEACTDLYAHTQTRISKVCGGVVNVKTPRQIYDAIWCALNPCNENPVLPFCPVDAPDWNCWEFWTPKCTRIVSGCLEACNSNDPCCVNRTRWQWNQGQCVRMTGEQDPYGDATVNCPSNPCLGGACTTNSCLTGEDVPECCN